MSRSRNRSQVCRRIATGLAAVTDAEQFLADRIRRLEEAWSGCRIDGCAAPLLPVPLGLAGDVLFADEDNDALLAGPTV